MRYLGSAASAIGAAPSPTDRLLSLDRDLLARLLGQLHGPLGNPARALDQELQILPNLIALEGNEVLRRAAAEQGIEPLKLLLEPVLSPVQPLPRDVLGTPGQHGAALGHGLNVPRGLLGRLLCLPAREAENGGELIHRTLGYLGGQAQTGLHDL